MAASRRLSTTALVLVGIAVAVALVVFVAPFASSAPDGLEKVSADTGIDAGATEHHLADGPFADYGVDGVDNDVLATGLAGLVGIAATFVVGAGRALARPRGAATAPGPSRPDGRRRTGTCWCTRRGRCTGWPRSASWRRPCCSCSPWSPRRRSSSGRSASRPASSPSPP